MLAAAIVVTFHTGALLRESLAAVRAAQGVGEIVVVDNGNDPVAERLLDEAAAADPRLRVIRGQGNVGFSAACNLGVAAATQPLLLFVNPDVVLDAAAPAALAGTLAATPGLALVGGDLRGPSGEAERGSRRDRVTLWRALVSFAGLSKLGFRDPMRHDDPLPAGPVGVGAVSGALMMMRKADFEQIGGFDEQYFMHVEDIDLCRRVEDAGGRVLFQPGPHGVHYRSSSQVSARDIARHKARSFAHYFRKFARGPVELAAAGLVGALLAWLLPLRAGRG